MDPKLSQLVAPMIVLERIREADVRARLYRDGEAERRTTRPLAARLADIARALGTAPAPLGKAG